MSATQSTLEISLPSDTEIHMTRVFDAPREMVFDAMTRPEHIVNWYGPREYVTRVVELDFRPGGSYRFEQTDAAGNVHAFLGEFREIVRPERVVQTWAYEPWKDHPSLETMTLVDDNGKTRVNTTSVFLSPEDRDGLVQSGMESGARASYERLSELLARLQGHPTTEEEG